MANRVKVNIKWLDAELFEKDDSEIAAHLEPMHGILVPGGFGERGTEGKIASVRFARERNVPFFGICLGMQMACIEGARNTAGIAAASSTEFGPTDEPVVGIITEWMTPEGLEKRRRAAIWAARCGWAPMRQGSTATAMSRRSTVRRRSASATATATK
jgi:CTP synthase